MNKKYIRWQIKNWLPMFFIILFFLGIIFILTMMNIPFGRGANNKEDLSAGLLSFSIPLFIVSLILPLAVYSDQVRENQADAFNQTPFKGNGLRKIRIFLALIIFLIAATLVFWFAILVFSIRQMTAVSSETVTYVRYNYQYYLCAYLFLIVEAALSYFTSCFFVSLGNTVINQVILLIGGEVILGFFLQFIIMYIGSFAKLPADFKDMSYYSFYLDCNFLSPLLLAQSYFDSLITTGAVSVLESTKFTYLITSMVIFNVAGIASLVYLLLVRDPSGEYSGKAGPRNKFIPYIIHLSFFFGINLFVSQLLFFITSVFGFTQFLVSFLMSGLGYYLVLALFYKTFRISKKEWTTMLVVLGLCLILFSIRNGVVAPRNKADGVPVFINF